MILSLVFVGMQIRESNIQARAPAYRAIGISTAEFHRGFTARMNRIASESEYREAEAVDARGLGNRGTDEDCGSPHAGNDPASG